VSWTAFNWGARGAQYRTDGGVIVPDVFIPNCIQVVVKGHTQEGTELLHVFDARSTHALPTSADVAALASAVEVWAADVFCANLVRTIDHVDEIICTSRAELNGPEATVGVNQDGARAASLGGVQLPNEVTIAVKKSTGIVGRSFRGRFFCWPLWSTDLNISGGAANQITDATATTILDTYESLRTAMAGAGSPLCVASNARTTLTDVTALSFSDLVVDAQRRRGPGRGS